MPPEGSAAEPYADVLDDTPCARHPGRAARLRCATCGARICVDCGAEMEGRRRCDACIAGVLAGEQRARTDPARERVRGGRLGLWVLLGVALVMGGGYALLSPSIERAKERSRIRAGEHALRKVFDAARLHAEDNARLLPAPEDGRAGTLAERLFADGYLRARPKNLPEARVVTAGASIDGDPYAVYLAEDDLHPSPEDGAPRRWVLRADGTIHELTETEAAKALAQGSVAGVVSATAFAQPPTATALPPWRRPPFAPPSPPPPPATGGAPAVPASPSPSAREDDGAASAAPAPAAEAPPP